MYNIKYKLYDIYILYDIFIVSVKLAPHFQKPKILSTVLFASTIVLHFLTGFKNSSVNLVKKNDI